jgi:hypothetical protein
MKAIIKNQISLAIVIIIAFSFIGAATVSAGETVLLASIDRSATTDKLQNYDFFPKYHHKAPKKEAERKERTMEIVVDTLVTDAEWVGGEVYAPVPVVTGEFSAVTDKIIVPYEVINDDDVGLIERVFSKHGWNMTEAADSLLLLALIIISSMPV